MENFIFVYWHDIHILQIIFLNHLFNIIFSEKYQNSKLFDWIWVFLFFTKVSSSLKGIFVVNNNTEKNTRNYFVIPIYFDNSLVWIVTLSNICVLNI